jgi:hypothetical protein
MKYKENKEKALEKLLNKQQQHIEQLEDKLINSDFIIDTMQKESDQYVLTCKFLTDTLLMLGQLEKLLSKNYSVFSQSLQTAIASFKVELSQAMRTIEYDGGDIYSFNPYIKKNNDVNDD